MSRSVQYWWLLKEPLGRHAAAAGLSALSADASRCSGEFKRALRGCVTLQRRVLSALSADAARQLDVFGHDGDSLGVDGAQVWCPQTDRPNKPRWTPAGP